MKNLNTTMPQVRPQVRPQLQVQTGLVAGESLPACQRNLEFWTSQLAKKCSYAPWRDKQASNQGYALPGYAPQLETEMAPWQAGDV